MFPCENISTQCNSFLVYLNFILTLQSTFFLSEPIFSPLSLVGAWKIPSQSYQNLRSLLTLPRHFYRKGWIRLTRLSEDIRKTTASLQPYISNRLCSNLISDSVSSRAATNSPTQKKSSGLTPFQSFPRPVNGSEKPDHPGKFAWNVLWCIS